MITIRFDNQDKYEGMVNKSQKEFNLDNVTEVLMIGDETKYVSLNLYFFVYGSRKAQAIINAPTRVYYMIERAMKKAIEDEERDHEIVISCIMSKWGVALNNIPIEKIESIAA